MILVRDLTFRYSQTGEGAAAREAPAALRGVSFELAAGERMLVCGGSGSGKSTLCRALNGLVPQFYAGEMYGSVKINGLDTREHSVAELFGTVGLVLQQPSAQFFCGTVYDELAYSGESLGMPAAEIERRAHSAAETVGVVDLLDRDPHSLSGGEQQLVLIAVMLAARPELLVLDEPYANLDPLGVSRVAEALHRVQAAGAAVVLSEHRVELAALDTDRILVLHRGTAVLEGPRAEVLQHDLEPFGIGLAPPARAAGEVAGKAKRRASGEATKRAAGQATGETTGEATDQATKRTPGRASDDSAGERVETARLSSVQTQLGGRPVLRGLDLKIYRGECLAIVGANGSGKTTTARQLLGLVKPDGGEVYLAGLDVRRTRPSVLAAHLGLAFQIPDNQFFRFTVAEEIAVGPKALRRHDPTYIRELMQLFELEHLADRAPFTLSTGEKKRVGFAAALASRPELLVLDEPTAGQDLQFRRALGGMLSTLTARQQTVVLITHDLAFAAEHAERWAVMAGGRVIAEGSPEEIMQRDEIMETAQLTPAVRTPAVRTPADSTPPDGGRAHGAPAVDAPPHGASVELKPAPAVPRGE